MDKKIIAIIIVAVLIIGGVATFMILKDDKKDTQYDDKAFNVIGRVNSEGSGLFIEKELLKADAEMPTRASNNVPFFGTGYTLSEANKQAWGGLIFGDPGVSSIQHTQLASIANSLGLKFAQYQAGLNVDVNTLYYVTNLSNYGTITASNDIQGGIIWEPQYQRVIQEASDRFTDLALTNDLFSGHTCCIIASNHNWLGSNSTTAVKFLAGYIDSVNYMKNAIAAGGDAYQEIINIAKQSTQGLTDEEIKDALANITYLYADDSNGSLSKLTKDIAQLSQDLKDIGVITSTKFNNPTKFSEAFVDDTYMKDAAAGKASKDGSASVRVAVIQGDIHQLAIHVGMAKGFFNNYNLTVTLHSGQNGGEIATLLLSKDVDIGFLGAPPATSNTINGDHILV